MTTLPLLLHNLGGYKTYKGTWYVLESVSLLLEDETRIQTVTKKLYPLVAKRFDTNSWCVERNIRTLIHNIWDHGNRKLLYKVAGRELHAPPRPGEFLSMLVTYATQLDRETPWR